MRLLALLSVLAAFTCGAQTTNDITRKVLERDRDKDGKPDSRVESVFRGKERVMRVWSKLDARAVWSVTSRAFYAGGDMVAVESDEDGDGFLETVSTYRSGTADMEVFTRQRDGTVQPVSAQALAAFKKQNAAITGFFEQSSGKDAGPEKLKNSIRETQKKLRDAEKEKKDAPK